MANPSCEHPPSQQDDQTSPGSAFPRVNLCGVHRLTVKTKGHCKPGRKAETRPPRQLTLIPHSGEAARPPPGCQGGGVLLSSVRLACGRPPSHRVLHTAEREPACVSQGPDPTVRAPRPGPNHRQTTSPYRHAGDQGFSRRTGGQSPQHEVSGAAPAARPARSSSRISLITDTRPRPTPAHPQAEARMGRSCVAVAGPPGAGTPNPVFARLQVERR